MTVGEEAKQRGVPVWLVKRERPWPPVSLLIPTTTDQLTALPEAVLLRILALLFKFELSSTCRANKAMARCVNDPSIYELYEWNAAACLGRGGGDYEAVIAHLSHPRFAHVRTLQLRNLKAVSTKLINSVRYRKALPDPPALAHLEHLRLYNVGVLATVSHVVGSLPSSLRTLVFGQHSNISGRFITPPLLQTLAARCPRITALDVSWCKCGRPWLECLDKVAEAYPGLRALDITYAGYPDTDEDRFDTHDRFEALLAPIRRLRRLRFLGVGHLGLAGGQSHKGTSGGMGDSASAPLRAAVAELTELRYLDVGGRRSWGAAAATEQLFLQHMRARHPHIMIMALSWDVWKLSVSGALEDGDDECAARMSVDPQTMVRVAVYGRNREFEPLLTEKQGRSINERHLVPK